jgi:PPM family protein phosphatase
MAENYFGITDTGRQRTNNEDTYIAEKVLKGQYIMGCVIDGVGGYSGGEVAASLARQSLLEYFSVPSGDVATMLKEALLSANKKIYNGRQQNAGNEQMACVLTVALADIKNRQFYYAHVGDTRLYLFRDASLIKVTKDHSFVGFLEDTGRLSEEGAMSHPKRNEINKALGFDEQIAVSSDYIDSGSSPFLPGDLLLLCSDGLTDMINKLEITSILNTEKTLEEKGRALVAAANNNGGKDNVTVVLVYNNEVPIKLKATRPKVVKKKDQQKNELIVEAPKTETRETIEAREMPEHKSNRSLVISLALFCLLLMGALGWLLFQRKPAENATVVTAGIQMNRAEKSLQDSISNFTGTTLYLPDSLYTQPFLLNDTLFISKDSLHLKGIKNFIFKSDSSFSGPAIVVDASVHYLLLENMTFENFKVAIWADDKKVHLKNVRFINCPIAVQQNLTFPDSKYVTGPLSDSSLFKTDSLPK